MLSVGMLLSTLGILSAGSLWPLHYLESVRLLVWGSISSLMPLYLPTAMYIAVFLTYVGEVVIKLALDVPNIFASL